jgi:hypothetical protein
VADFIHFGDLKMSLITTYYSKLDRLAVLKLEIAELESSAELETELAFLGALEELLSDHNKTARDVAKIFAGEVVLPAGKRAKRSASTWTNPNTGERVVTAGGNHKTLKNWREQYGKEAVASWKA